MNFIERMIVRKEIDMSLDYLKKHWLLGLHILGAVAIFLSPSMDAFIKTHPQYTALAFVWAEVMRWLQSPNNRLRLPVIKVPNQK